MKTRRRPCRECPWVTSTDPGQFPAERYEALEATTGERGAEAPIGSPLFACHKSIDGAEMPCAGWLAAVGIESIPVRLLVSFGEIPSEALRPGPDWPDLFESYEEMAAAMGRRRR